MASSFKNLTVQTEQITFPTTTMLLKLPARLAPSQKSSKVIDSLILRANNSFRHPLHQKIFFLHIDKCGGTSINQAIKSCYLYLDITKDRNLAHLNSIGSFIAAKTSSGKADFPPDEQDDYTVLKFRENILLYYMSQSHINFISGHFSFSEMAYQHFHSQYAFITILREPVARWISSYYYNRYKSWQHRKINLEINEYLETELGRSHGYEYVKFLGGPNQEEDYSSPHAISRTKENLHKFSIVGCLEHQEDFIDRFNKKFGRKLNIGFTNRSPKPKSGTKPAVTEEIKEKIRAICKPDIEVYRYAIDNFVGK